MKEPKWLSRAMVEAIHDESIAMFGGLSGIRDEGLLESALGKAQHIHPYSDSVTLFMLGAAYGFGIIKNHPFLDGNKRAGLLAMRAFLFLNGYLFEPSEPDEVTVIVAVADGSRDQESLAKWLEANSTPR